MNSSIREIFLPFRPALPSSLTFINRLSIHAPPDPSPIYILSVDFDEPTIADDILELSRQHS